MHVLINAVDIINSIYLTSTIYYPLATYEGKFFDMRHSYEYCNFFLLYYILCIPYLAENETS